MLGTKPDTYPGAPSLLVLCFVDEKKRDSETAFVAASTIWVERERAPFVVRPRYVQNNPFPHTVQLRKTTGIMA